jgi:hypothetical protein
MLDYICTTVACFDCLIKGKWQRKQIGLQAYNGQNISNDDLIYAICDNFPTVTRESILYIIRIDNPEVPYSDIGAFFEGIMCRSLVDKDFSVGEIIIVNQKLFDQYVKNTVIKYGGGF